MRKREAVARFHETEAARQIVLDKLTACQANLTMTEADLAAERVAAERTVAALETEHADLLAAQATTEQEREWRRTAQDAAADAELRAELAGDQVAALTVEAEGLRAARAAAKGAHDEVVAALQRCRENPGKTDGSRTALADLVEAIDSRSTGPKKGTRSLSLGVIATELAEARFALKPEPRG